MARLPDTLPMQGPRGAAPSDAALDFRGLDAALQGAAKQLSGWDEKRREADDLVAGRELETARQTYSEGAGQRAAMYDGRSPGFAQAELSAFDEAMAPLLARDDLSDGERDSLTRQSRDLRTRVGAEAIALESRARGQRAAADRDAADTAQAYRAYMGAMAVFDGMQDLRRREWDGATPGFAEGLLGDYRLASEQALTGLSAPVADRLRPLLQSREVQLQAGAMQAEDESRDAATLRTVGDGLTALVNRAARDPGLLTTLDAEMAPILAAAPAHLRPKLAEETKASATTLALNTRITGGDFEAVRAEVAEGRYDWMDPTALERVGAAIETADAVRTAEDALAEQDLAAEVDADLQAILAGGQPKADLAARVETLLGPDQGAQVRVNQQAAQRVQPLMARLRTMSPAQAMADLDRYAASAGDAVGAKTLELARAMVTQDQTLRGGDPATWAASEIGPGDNAARTVRERLAAFQDGPSAQTAQAYARATWNAQAAGGIGELQRRILPSDTAEAWIAALDADGAPSDALPRLAARVELFGAGFSPQVTRELTLAGLKPRDLGAMMHYAETPSRMALFVRGRAQPLNELVKTAEDRRAIDIALSSSLAPWNQAFGSGEGQAATMEAARTVAYGMVARGERVQDAVRTATAPMTETWSFQGSWAIPTNRGLDGRAIRLNAREHFQRLAAPFTGEPDLYAAASSDGKTEAQRRDVYQDHVLSSAQWRNLADGSGVKLVMPTRDGTRWIEVQDRAGRPIRRTWAQLERRP